MRELCIRNLLPERNNTFSSSAIMNISYDNMMLTKLNEIVERGSLTKNRSNEGKKKKKDHVNF